MTLLVYSKSFILESANIDYTIQDNGVVKVTEQVRYNLKCAPGESFSEVYKDFPIGLELYNAKGECLNQNCQFKQESHLQSVSGTPELILILEKGCGIVDAVYEYEVRTLIKHPDTVQFYYKLWGDTSQEIKNLDISVNMPGSFSETTYFIHPWSHDLDVKNQTNSIKISGKNYPRETFVEINLLMPPNWFSNSPQNVFVEGTSNKEEIIKGEKNDETCGGIFFILSIIFLVLISISFFVPWLAGLVCYFVYGTELSKDKVGYFGLYERDPPSAHTPAEVQSFITGKYAEENSLQATIVFLAAKNWIKIEKEKEEFVLKFTEKGEKLKDFENDVYEKLKSYCKNDKDPLTLNLKKFKNTIANRSEFYYWYQSWMNKVENSLKINQYMDDLGFQIFKKFSTIFAVALFLLLIVFLIIPYEIGDIFLVLTLLSLGSCLLSTFILTKKRIWLGRWNSEGRVLNLKWNNFKKYLSDYSLLKEHPPQSVVLWEHYLAYAVAFGVAKETIKHMKQINPEFIETSNNFNTFTYMYVGTYFATRYSPPSSTSSSGFSGGWSGGFSGSGGGFGGGGFGAR